MTEVMILWFVLLANGPVPFIEPITVRAQACTAPSPGAGTLLIDREVNPQTVRWDNCLVDVRAYVAKLQQEHPGVYEIATTDRGIPGYISPDPHTLGPFVVAADFEEQAGPVRPTDKFVWTTTDSIVNAANFRFDLELDTVLQPATALVTTCVVGTPNSCEAPIPAMTTGPHTIKVRMVDISVASSPITGPYSDPLTFTMRATPGKPGGLGIKPFTPPGGDDHADAAPEPLPSAPLVLNLGQIGMTAHQ